MEMNYFLFLVFWFEAASKQQCLVCMFRIKKNVCCRDDMLYIPFIFGKCQGNKQPFSYFSGGVDGREIGVFRHSCFSYVYQSIFEQATIKQT